MPTPKHHLTDPAPAPRPRRARKVATVAPHATPAKPAPSTPSTPSRRAPAVRSAASTSRRQRQVEDKRSLILDAALGCFSRFGLHGTSLDQVAAKADVSKSNLLYYFPSKEALYLSVLRELLTVWLAPLRGFSVDQDARQAIADYIRKKLVISRDRPEASRLFCLEVVQGAPLLRDELAHQLRELVQHKAEVIRAWVAAGQLAPVDPHHLIFTLWAATQHYADFGVQIEAITGRTLAEPAFFEETVDNLQRIVLQGIAPVPAV